MESRSGRRRVAGAAAPEDSRETETEDEAEGEARHDISSKEAHAINAEARIARPVQLMEPAAAAPRSWRDMLQ